MTNNITTVQVGVISAPLPATLQQTGAMISQGATTLTAGTYSPLTQAADLTPLLAPALVVTISQSAGTATALTASTTISSGTYNSTTGLVTLTLVADIGLKVGSSAIVSSATGTGSYADINGTYTAAVGSGGTTLEYTIATSETLSITGGSVEIGHGITTSDTFLTTIAGANQAGYNGTFLATATTATAFTFAVPSSTVSPATGTIKYTPRNQTELVAMVTTYFAQGNVVGVYVLELGAGEVAAGVTALGNYITSNPNSAYTPGALGYFYAYLIPSSWDAVASFITFLASYESNTAQTYFFVTTTTANYSHYTLLMKDVFALIQSPTAPLTEFSLAAPFYQILSERPSATNKVAPFAFRFLYGVTPYSTQGNGALLSTLKTANINYVGTGAEGGITTATLFWGTTADGKQLTYWYSIDWIQINEQVAVDNAVINGSNTKTNPLYYNQAGINRLQRVAQTTAGNAVTFGLGNGTVIGTALDGPDFINALDAGTYNGKIVINAVPFLNYVSENPSDYGIGEYDGLTCLYIDQTGFIHILFNITVTGFITV